MPSLGSLFGSMLVIALFGALLAWLLRLALRARPVLSYGVGVAVSTLLVVVNTRTFREEFDSPAASLATGILCGLVAFGLLCLTARRRQPRG